MITYKESGVDIDKGNRLVDNIKSFCKSLPSENIISSIGGFSALYSLENFGSDIVLSSATDGVGTKLLVAQMAGVHNSVGIDLVAMNVNDIITNGTNPIFFLDYISYSDLDDQILSDLIKGITKGLQLSNSALIGGETAQMPGLYKKGEYDLAGFCVGIANKNDLIKNDIKENNCVIGVSSSGFHSNGYSLLRKLFFEVAGYKIDSLINGRNLSDILLKPTNIYVNLFKDIKKYTNAAVHITGGGFYENIPRVLNKKFDVIIDRNSLPEREEFVLVQDIGKLSDYEMYRTFNMGVGFLIIAEESNKDVIMNSIKKHSFEAYDLGYIKKGKGEVKIV